MQTLTKATIGKTMQKEEWINTILQEITNNPKITNNALADKYCCNRNVISKYRNLIRKNQLIANMETVNKIDTILETRLPQMEDRDLINLRKQLVPQQLDINGNMNLSQKGLIAKIDLTKLDENAQKTILDAEEALTKAESLLCKE